MRPSRVSGVCLIVLLAVAWNAGAAQARGADHAVPSSPQEPGPPTLLEVPASTRLRAPVPYPEELATGERLLIEVQGEIRGAEPDTSGAIAGGALVASFNGGPPFLVVRPANRRASRRDASIVWKEKLLWTAPAGGRLAFAVAGASRRLTGGYSVGLTRLGRRGDPRQERFPAPWIAFVVPAPEGAFLAVIYRDRAGFGVDTKTLSVILDTARGERVVLSPYFLPDSMGATLPALPPEVGIPPGVHRVTARIGDALGNVSPEAVIFLDQP